MEPSNPRKLIDLLLPLLFCGVAVVATILWLVAIGWVVWQPISYVFSWVLE